jgi:hypothetical protein
MTPIRSIYISHIQCAVTAEHIANVLDKNGIAQVSKVLIEPYKSSIKNGIKYNCAYVAIYSWHETESAYNFIKRLRNPTRETRLIYTHDDWWPVYINKYHSKFESKRVLTVFKEKEDATNIVMVKDHIKDHIKIDVQKTYLLRNIIANFKNKSNDNKMANDNNVADFNSYLHEMDEERYMWASE